MVGLPKLERLNSILCIVYSQRIIAGQIPNNRNKKRSDIYSMEMVKIFNTTNFQPLSEVIWKGNACQVKRLLFPC
jgi:hypothetical protein